ncbi:MAG: hypothetical protein KIG81_11745, partial [Thermoguttaceae bacterium]|nr:hypothetical protein [Thermoguttaceae bacterium]
IGIGAGATGSPEPKLIAKGPLEKKKLKASARRGVRREKTPSATKLAAITMILVVRIEFVPNWFNVEDWQTVSAS